MHYYQFNIGDYRKDTQHLSLVEHAIYRLLLDTYYLNEGPLTQDKVRLMRTHNVRSADEVLAFENVLSDFFDLTKEGYFHAKCDHELQKVYKKSAAARASAEARWKKKGVEKQAVENTPMRDECKDDAIACKTDANDMLPITHHPLPITKEKTRPSSKIEGQIMFDRFWELYPRKVKKKDAAKAFLKLNAETQRLCIEGVLSRVWSDNPRLNPHPTTFINGDRWTDEPDEADRTNHAGRKPTQESITEQSRRLFGGQTRPEQSDKTINGEFDE